MTREEWRRWCAAQRIAAELAGDSVRAAVWAAAEANAWRVRL